MWSGALFSCALSIVCPACVMFLMSFIVYQARNAASVGVMCSVCLGLLHGPIRRSFSDDDLRSRRSTAFRLKQACHDAELKNRSDSSLVQTLLEAPISIFPYVLVISTLVFGYCFNGVVTHREIFACRQVLGALVHLSSMISDCMKSPIALSRSGSRVRHCRFVLHPSQTQTRVRLERTRQKQKETSTCGCKRTIVGRTPVPREACLTGLAYPHTGVWEACLYAKSVPLAGVKHREQGGVWR